MRFRFFFILALGTMLLLTFSRASPARAAVNATFTVNSTLDEIDKKPGDGICKSKPSGKCTLRAAIMETNALAGADQIVLPAQTYLFTRSGPNEDDGVSGDMDITDKLKIVGQGAATTVIDANTLDRVLHVRRGKLILSKVTLTHGDTGASTYDRGAGVLVDAGARLIFKSVVITDTEADGFGGALSNFGTATLKNSTIHNNENRYNDGGGIANALGATLTLLNSTISNNTAGGSGGGIVNVGMLIAVNSTLSGNISTNSNGGGIHNIGTVNLYNVTIANNTAGAAYFGGGISSASGAVTLRNTILVNNKVATNSFPFFFYNDCGGILTSNDFNLLSDTQTCTIPTPGPNDLYDVSGELGALANNGGPTQTHLPNSGSPVIDTGNPAGCIDHNGNTLLKDQRGMPRPVKATTVKRCDRGAVEVSAP